MPKQRNVDIVNLADIEKEYTHLAANIELMRRDPSLLLSGGKHDVRLPAHNCSLFPEPIVTPWVTVSKLTQEGQYDLAMHTAKVLGVDMSELFQRLASHCLQLSDVTDLEL